jgi:hypothetical protein
MISTTDKDPASFTTLASYPNSVMSTTSWNWSAVDLSEYAGQTVYIAFAQRSAMDSWRIQEIVIRDADAEVETRFPENKETKVPTDAVLRVTFDKNVFENDFSKITITPAVTGISARTENNVLYINHNDFQYDTEYTVTIPAETVDYHTGNITWSFRTWLAPVDVASVAVLPEHNATNVPLDAAVRVTFDIDVEEDFNFENISISPAVEGVEAFYRNKVLAVFSRNFAPKTTYTVTVPARAIDRLRNDVVWTFTTAEGTATNNQNVFVATEPNVMIWPNPSNGEIHVKVGEKSTVKIFDLNGVQLGLHTVGANSELKLNQTPGVYFIRVENHLGTTAHKVIVQ